MSKTSFATRRLPRQTFLPSYCGLALLTALFRAAAAASPKQERITPATAVRDLPTLIAFLDEYEANVVDLTGQTVVHWAASTGATQAIDYAMEQGADPMRKDAEGRTPLHIAALSGHVEAVSGLLWRHGALGAALVEDGSGALPLHRAALAGSAEVVAALAKAEPRSLDAPRASRRGGGTALHTAAYMGHVTVLEALLEAGASPCLRNKDGELPIDTFVEEDDDQVAKVLEEARVVEEEARRRVVALLRGATLACDKSGDL